MRIFQEFPSNDTCIICKTNENKDYWLMPVDNLLEGITVQSKPVHVDCTGKKLINKLRYSRESEIVYAFI